MYDLWIAYGILAIAAAAVFILSFSIARRQSRLRAQFIAGVVVLALFAYIRWVWYSPTLADWLPWSNLVVLGNWLPLFAAALAGLVWHSAHRSPLRRVTTVGVLFGCGLLASLYPLLGSPPKCTDHWDSTGMCLQTTTTTCSPACAAAILKRHGIDATESEMAELCLTRSGTSWLGLYRGLKLKTAGTRWDVRIVHGSLEEIACVASRPMILSVGLPSDAPANSDYTHEFGWVPGVNHSVIVERFTSSGCAVVADPSQPMSREQWDGPTLRTLWRGHAFQLVPRKS